MSFVSPEKINFLINKAVDVRMSIIDMLEDAKSGHTAGPLGMADIFTVLYFHTLIHYPNDPQWEGRDRLVLSNGHIVPVQYSAMAHAGYFPVEELKTLRKFKSRLQGHPERILLPGLETTSGPLGSGLSQSAGMALGFKMDQKPNRVYCLLSDGEMDAGNIWEAGMFASANNLDNLVGIIDRNNIQINGRTEDVMPLEPLDKKWEAFGWHVMEIDGHNIETIIYALEHAKSIHDKPTMIIANTIPGKGIKEIENDYTWHGKPPDSEQEKRFLAELRSLKGKIDPSHNS